MHAPVHGLLPARPRRAPTVDYYRCIDPPVGDPEAEATPFGIATPAVTGPPAGGAGAPPSATGGPPAAAVGGCSSACPSSAASGPPSAVRLRATCACGTGCVADAVAIATVPCSVLGCSAALPLTSTGAFGTTSSFRITRCSHGSSALVLNVSASDDAAHSWPAR